MYDKDTRVKKTSCDNSSEVINNNEEYIIPYEAACSHEFSEGCIVAEDDSDK